MKFNRVGLGPDQNQFKVRTFVRHITFVRYSIGSHEEEES